MSMAMALCDDVGHAQTWTRSLVLDLQVLLFFTARFLHLALVAVVFAVGATNLRGRHESVSEENILCSYFGYHTFYECPLIMLK